MERNQNYNLKLKIYITNTVPHSTEFKNRTITDPRDMSNVFNNYFTSIAKKTNPTIKFSPKYYTDYLPYTNANTFFLTPTIFFPMFDFDNAISQEAIMNETIALQLSAVVGN